MLHITAIKSQVSTSKYQFSDFILLIVEFTSDMSM